MEILTSFSGFTFPSASCCISTLTGKAFHGIVFVCCISTCASLATHPQHNLLDLKIDKSTSGLSSRQTQEKGEEGLLYARHFYFKQGIF
jgi:hypothetical protein